MRAARLLVSVVLVACRGPSQPARPAQPDTTLATSNATASPCDRPAWKRPAPAPRCDRPASNLDEVPDDVRGAFVLLEQVTRDVIGSPAFRTAVQNFPQVDGRAGADWISGYSLARTYAGELADYHLAPTCFRLDSGSGETASTGVVTKCKQVDGQFAAIAIHAFVLTRLAALPEGRACAINTLAHEWTHAILRDPHRAGLPMVFLDGDHQDFDEPVASYTTGAIAQCVYLKQWRPELDLEACVRAVGTSAFRPCTCEAGWLDALIAGETSCKNPPPSG
jgi:hypothetical protein